MNTHQNMTVTCAALTLFLSSCSSSSNNNFRLEGAVDIDDGYSLALNSEVVVGWEVISTNPHHTYLSVNGSIDEDGYSIELPSTLHDDAINSYGVAVGFVGTMVNGSVPPAGLFYDDVEDSAVLGAIDAHVLIYKNSDDFDILGWPKNFSFGYSCGKVQPKEAGRSFNTFEPVSCEGLRMRIGDVSTFTPIDWH